MVNRIDPTDAGYHPPPPGADERWQESWALVWHDPLERAGGLYHIGLQRVRGVADVWSWTAVDGAVVGRYQSLTLPLPEQDLPDFELGGLTVATKEPLRSCTLRASYEAARAEVVYEAFTDPFAYSMDSEGSAIGAAHYESVGRVNGTVTTPAGELAVSGFAWQDHSWGPRHWPDVLSHRWIWATFGPDLFVSVMTVVTAAGSVPLGYVYESGRFHGVAKVDFGARVADDGHSPLGCDARVWTRDGHGYRLTSTVHTASPSSHDGGFWFTDGLALYEMGGRLGAGILEAHDLSGPTPWHRQALGLP